MKDQVPALARRLHLRGEVRHPRLAGRRPRQRARDDRPRRGRRDRAQAARRGRRGVEIVAWVRAGRGPRGRRSTRDGHARRRSRRTPCAARTPTTAAADDRAHRRGAEGRRLARRRRRVRRARRAGRAWASRCSTSSRPTWRKAMLSLPASKGFEIGSGFAGTLLTGSAAQRSVLRRRRAASRTRTQPLGRRAGRHLATARTSSCASRSSRPRRSCASSRPSTATGTTRPSRRTRPPRSVRAAARGADGRGDGGAGARRSFPAPARPVRLAAGAVVLAAGVALASGAGCTGARPCGCRCFRCDAAVPAARRTDRGAAPDPLHVHRARRGDVQLARQRRHAALLGEERRAAHRRRRRSPEPVPFSSPGPWQEAVADGLRPGTEYLYEVGHPVRPMTLSFRAPAGAPAPSAFTFVAVGDIGRRRRAGRGARRAPADPGSRAALRARARRSDLRRRALAGTTSTATSTT